MIIAFLSIGSSLPVQAFSLLDAIHVATRDAAGVAHNSFEPALAQEAPLLGSAAVGSLFGVPSFGIGCETWGANFCNQGPGMTGNANLTSSSPANPQAALEEEA